ncbi:hypothetical protein DFH08DRAFT_799805 [Mycena albidolilacea]|uniref:HAT C-terminal dimerisation domain-containing protein n=1 Tax=Mycena albidolilacea TaxID=1033008 RepID=A0AAD7AMD7_9AGAR|nr:hypothetical protein DFH08DRAFT_799805 [Mycena albidolilacea]
MDNKSTIQNHSFALNCEFLELLWLIIYADSELQIFVWKREHTWAWTCKFSICAAHLKCDIHRVATGRSGRRAWCTPSALSKKTATSTDVERSFSRGGFTVSKMRHSLSDESTRAATVLGSWVDVMDVIPRSEIVSKLKSKASRLKTIAGSSSATSALLVVDSDDE